jgi:hypothetical protein
MTVSFCNFRWSDADGRLFCGEVYWDKLHQGKILARIWLLITPAYADDPIWEASARYLGKDRRQVLVMVGKIKARAKRLKLELVSERETEFAPKA